jgi:hypothetical protein
MNEVKRAIINGRMHEILFKTLPQSHKAAESNAMTAKNNASKKPPSDNALPQPLADEVDKLAVIIEAAKNPVTVPDKITKLRMLDKFIDMFDESISEQLEEIRDVLLQLPDSDEVQ